MANNPQQTLTPFTITLILPSRVLYAHSSLILMVLSES